MSRMRIKICGITSLEDALHAADAGADALGFVFHPRSPRFISPETAGIIIARLPPFVTAVGLFVDASQETIEKTVGVAGLQCLQLHGDETPEFCTRFRMPVIKAFRVRGQETLERLAAYSKVTGWLLDAFVEGQPGGTGARFDWRIANEAGRLGRPVILAGGLTPDNVTEAISAAHPFAVDVSSGVESSPGVKSAVKVTAFLRASVSANFA